MPALSRANTLFVLVIACPRHAARRGGESQYKSGFRGGARPCFDV